MFAAIFVAGLMLLATGGCKAFLGLLASMPLMGPVATWYVGYVGDIGDGLAANVIYWAMSMHLLFMALAPFLYGPILVRKTAAWIRAGRLVDHTNS